MTLSPFDNEVEFLISTASNLSAAARVLDADEQDFLIAEVVSINGGDRREQEDNEAKPSTVAYIVGKETTGGESVATEMTTRALIPFAKAIVVNHTKKSSKYGTLTIPRVLHAHVADVKNYCESDGHAAPCVSARVMKTNHDDEMQDAEERRQDRINAETGSPPSNGQWLWDIMDNDCLFYSIFAVVISLSLFILLVGMAIAIAIVAL